MEYKVKDVTRVIEEFAPLSIQEGWDNSGLCVGSPEAPVTSVLLGLDCTEELVDEAVACGADMIVTHHPLIFSGLKKISPEDQTGAAVIKAIKAGISVYAAHTSADKVIAGVSGARRQDWVLRMSPSWTRTARERDSVWSETFRNRCRPRRRWPS